MTDDEEYAIYYRGYKAGRHDRESLEERYGEGTEDDGKGRYNSGSLRNLHELFNELSRKSQEGIRIPVEYPKLIDPTSAYHNGLLDAVNNNQSLSPVLIAADQRVLNDRYC